ncbi:MAG: acetyl-CoA carboxylase biotin carboxyl carrier protein [Pseudomonadota bacterium]
MSKPKQEDTSDDLTLIRSLAGVLDETGLTEIEIERNDVRVRVARGGAPMAVSYDATPQRPQPPEPQVDLPAATEPAAASAPPPGSVTSPMVGTVYLSPSPGAAPFASVGSSVKEGDTVMIIEAMKTMNPVVAPRSGSVTSILVRNEQPVEFGEPLLTIE